MSVYKSEATLAKYPLDIAISNQITRSDDPLGMWSCVLSLTLSPFIM